MNLSKTIYYICLAFAGSIILLIVISIIPVPGNFKVLTVLSGSMEPAIKTGSVVFVKPAHSTGSGQADYKIGDIITFGDQEGSEALTTHRIVEIEIEDGKTLYTVKGDANNAADTRKVPSENVVGKTLFSIPFLGYLLNFAKQPIGFILLIWVPAIIIIWEEIEKIRKELKRKPKIEPKTEPKADAKIFQGIKEISKIDLGAEPGGMVLKNNEFERKNKVRKIKVVEEGKVVKCNETNKKKRTAKSDEKRKLKKKVKSEKIIRGRKATESKKVKRTKIGKENKK